MDSEVVPKCTLVYINNDDIPECIVDYGYAGKTPMLMSYRNGKVYELVEPSWGKGYIGYIKKQNAICISGYNGSNSHCRFYKMTDSSIGYEQVGYSVAEDYNYSGEDYWYYIGVDLQEFGGEEEDVGKERYDEYNNSFGKMEDYEFPERSYSSVQEAYNALK